MKRFIALIIATFTLCFAPIYAQRSIAPEDKTITAEVRQKYPKHSVYYNNEYGVYLLEETITPTNSKLSDYKKYSLLDNKGTELFPCCSFNKIYFKCADELNKNYYPYIEAHLEKTMWALSFDGYWLTMPIKGNISSFKQKDKQTQKTKIWYLLPKYPLKYSPVSGFYLYNDKGKSPKIKSTCSWIDINGNYTTKSPVTESNDKIIERLVAKYKIGVLYDAATHTYRAANGALCDKDGNELVPPAQNNEYTWSKFYQGYALVHNANTQKYGIYSLKGERLIPVEHFGIEIKCDENYKYFVCHTTAKKTYDKNYNATIYDMAGNLLIPPYYGTVHGYNNNYGFSMRYGYSPEQHHFKIFLDENFILDTTRSQDIDYSIPDAYFARIKANEEKRIEEERIAAERRAAAQAAQIQRQQAWQQLAAAVDNLATNVNNAINQHSGGSKTYSSAPKYTYSQPSSTTSNTSVCNTTELQHCKRYYSEWESKAGYWMNKFVDEQAWFKANKNSIPSQLELSGHQRNRNDARSQLKNIQSMLQNYRSRAAKVGGNIPKGLIETKIDGLLNQPNY